MLAEELCESRVPDRLRWKGVSLVLSLEELARVVIAAAVAAARAGVGRASRFAPLLFIARPVRSALPAVLFSYLRASRETDDGVCPAPAVACC